jgi:hypothetical protein
MVWPSRARFGDFDGVSTSYRRAAADVGAVLIPAGDAWRAAWRRDASVALYAPDQFHPSPLGTYLAALATYEALAGQSVVGLAPGIALGDLTAGRLRLLQEAAHEAVTADRPAPPPGPVLVTTATSRRAPPVVAQPGQQSNAVLPLSRLEIGETIAHGLVSNRPTDRTSGVRADARLDEDPQ